MTRSTTSPYIDDLIELLSSRNGHFPITLRFVRQQYPQLSIDKAREVFVDFAESIKSSCLKIYSLIWNDDGSVNRCGLVTEYEMEDHLKMKSIDVLSCDLYCVLGMNPGDKIPFALIQTAELGRMIFMKEEKNFEFHAPQEDLFKEAAELHGLTLNQIKLLLNKCSSIREEKDSKKEQKNVLAKANTMPSKNGSKNKKRNEESGQPPTKKMKQSSLTAFFGGK